MGTYILYDLKSHTYILYDWNPYVHLYMSFEWVNFCILRLSNSSYYAYNGREKAPMAANSTMYSKLAPNASQRGPLAIGVPGEIAALYQMHKQHGSLPWKKLFERPIE